MEAKLKTILKNLPAKKPRSRLEPYRELIREMRRRGRSYREIIQVLHEECNLQVSVSTLHDFVRLHSRSKQTVSPYSGTNKIKKARGRLAELSKDIGGSIGTQKSRKEYKNREMAHTELQAASAKKPSKRTLFHYDPDEPLRLQPNQRTQT
jgi:hypothetical protein